MENKLFREKSLEKIASPEQLHDYMRVTTPRLWMILGAILALLAGFIIYASTATVENTMPIQMTTLKINVPKEIDGKIVDTDELMTVCYSLLPYSYKDIVQAGMTVRLGELSGKVSIVSTTDDEYVEEALSLYIKMDDLYIPVPDGTYDAELVLESATPISFLWN